MILLTGFLILNVYYYITLLIIDMSITFNSYEYDYMTYGHLGGFRCPSCGSVRRQPDAAVSSVLSSDAEKSELVITVGDKDHPTTVNLPGGYNIYNAVSTMAFGMAMNLDLSVVSRSLSSFECGFGR